VSGTLFRVIGCVVIVSTIFAVVRGVSREIRNAGGRSRPLGWLAGLMGLLAFVGIGGFFAQWLVGTGTLPLPNSFQWPAGRVRGIAKTQDGIYVVPLVPISRVQIYDADWHFLRGWNVDTGGKDFTIEVTLDGVIDIRTSRYLYSFSQSGTLLNKEDVEMPLGGYWSSPSSRGEAVMVPTSPFLLIFSHPFFSWGVAMAGWIGMAFVRVAARSKP